MSRVAKLHTVGLTLSILALIAEFVGIAAAAVWIGRNVEGDALVVSFVFGVMGALILVASTVSAVMYTYDELRRELR